MKEMMARLAALPDHTVVVYYYLALDGNGEEFKPWKVVRYFQDLTRSGLRVGRHLHGTRYRRGRLLSYAAHGRIAGEMGWRILNGEKPADIPPTSDGPFGDIFDRRQLKRWNIDESHLPEGSIVRFREVSVWEKYRW